MRFTDACFAAVVTLMVPGVSRADDGLPYEQKKDVVYAEAHGTGLLMDVFTPTGKPNGLGIVDIASGAWYSDRNKIRDHTLAQVYTIFCSRGYVVFAVRPGSKTRYTAAEMDRNVKSAIRYIKAHAGEYKIDPARLGLTGGSAGGHLATLAALTPEPAKAGASEPDRPATTPPSGPSACSSPRPTSSTGTATRPSGSMSSARFCSWEAYGGHSEDEIKEAARAVSPLHRVEKPTIPFLLIHGDADKTVPLSQSKKLVEAITKAGGSAELIVKPGGGHPWLTIPQEVKVMADWFDKQLHAQQAQ